MKRIILTIALLTTASTPAFAEGPEVPADTQKLADLLRAASEKGTPAKAESAVAATPTPTSAVEPYGPIGSMIAWALGLGAILVGGAFFARRMKERGMFEATSKELRVDESLWVGRGQRILLLSVGARRVLVGVTSSGFEGIAVMEDGGADATEVPVPMPRASGPTTPGPKFADVVKDELVSSFKPSQNDRRRIIERLNTL